MIVTAGLFEAVPVLNDVYFPFPHRNGGTAVSHETASHCFRVDPFWRMYMVNSIVACIDISVAT